MIELNFCFKAKLNIIVFLFVIDVPFLQTTVFERSKKSTFTEVHVRTLASVIFMRSAFDEVTNQRFNYVLINQHEKPNDSTPQNAVEDVQTYPELSNNSYKIATYVLLNLNIVVILLGIWFYFKRKPENSRKELAKVDTLLEKILLSDSDTISGNSGFAEHNDRKNKDVLLFKRIYNYLLREERFTSENLNRNYTAKKLHTNVKYITSAVKLNTGLSYSEYINQLRVAKAIKMIRDIGYTITNEELSESCGYKTTASFYRNFKRVTGITPNEFKMKLYRGKNKLDNTKKLS
jgi:YesN/AraC family two-component response regulator